MMGSRQRKPKATPAGRLVRGRRLDRNPLRRTSDRAESLVLILLVVGFLVAAPLVALASGGWTHAMAQRSQLVQAASRRQVTAVVLTAAALPPAGSESLVADVQARWTAPDGTVATGQVPVPVGTAAGAKVQVWTTRGGQLTTQPLNDSQVASIRILGEVAGVAAVAALVVLSGILTRWSLDKRRLAAWDDDWQATGPRWTTRT